jgi:hypothetical protein
MGIGSTPSASSLDLTLGVAKAFATSPLSLSTMARGVLAGKNMPIQNGYSASWKPASAVVGTSGSTVDLVALFTTSAVSMPSFTNGKCIPNRGEEEVEATGDDLVDCLRSALEGNVHRLYRGARHEAHCAEMGGGSDTG